MFLRAVYDKEYENNTFREYNIFEEKSGINSLKIKLEKMYCYLIRKNAPKLEKDIEEKINQSKNKLSKQFTPSRHRRFTRLRIIRVHSAVLVGYK